ncbi:MAG: ABC transporter ATP-binding protein [Planctomycetes bacterium]|jgi:ABC-type Fe3+/spermidine/putrescine transport system ATPase subunit|nr:ABC transporter ATP-binding protein [Planctomycetota bacterium]
MNTLLSIEGLTLARGGFVLGPVSLALGPGERLVLLGPSGGGKTTLLRCLCGLAAPDEGRIRLQGRDVSDLPPERRDVGYVPQAATLFPHLDVAGNVAFGLRSIGLPAGERAARVAGVLELLGIAPLARRRTAGLSGGEAKRVALARSLVLRPSLLLLDEPLAGLDGRARDSMAEALREAWESTRTATIHVTHDREEAWLLAGRCAVMDGGRLMQDGPIEEVFRRPANRFVAEFLGGGNVLGTEGNLVYVRPEDLVPAAPGEEAHYAGTLTAVTDRGAFAELRVRLPDGTVLLARVPPAAIRGLAHGSPLPLHRRAPPHPLGDVRTFSPFWPSPGSPAVEKGD